MCAKIACCLSRLNFTFIYAGSSIQNAREQFVSCVHLYFVNFALHPTPQTNKHPNHQRRGRDEQCARDSNICISVTIQFRHIFIWTSAPNDRCYHLKKYWLSSWIALRMYLQWKPLHTLCSWSGCWPIRRPWIIVVLLTEYKDFGCAVAESR